MFKSTRDIDNMIKKHSVYREGCLNLIASENFSSEKVRSYLSCDLGNRYGCYSTLDPSDREYTGNKYIHEIEMETQELIKEVFKAKYADLRPIGGHMAGMSVVLALLEPGDLVIEVSLKDWGHGLVGPMCQVRQFDETIRVKYMKFTEDREVDVEALKIQVKELNPKLVIFGGSGTLFQEPVRELRPLADEIGFHIAYDAAHVTGLIASGVFKNPLEEGADIMFGSTHKSFPGPQGGFVVSNNKELINKVGNTLSPSLVTSHHLNRLPALAASILEMKEFGYEYGQQIVKNSKALAKALDKYGFDVIGKNRGFTESHLLLLNLGDIIDTAPAKYLEKANILVSDDFSGGAPEVRIGTPEITRRGFKENDMETIAIFFKRLLIDKDSIEEVGKDVENYARNFTGIDFSF
ncbi:aminotransferase class I/II-fold pyridoxal phosphate-dependent enzyme [Tissierella sp. Yu-01]|uniref:serine hydroxymethyltransferase n=1 Tax=Tissierella sp. Yu-01 TaxID=3035694 RepID=UPI00240E199E|nr:aminotransferase class I/II-fold pyridoxal phosphate-dependent enzyme [Tissierella sp. Yu-01]WFA09995.1 aminotransferase class I/II-fold pyridoxal phosphate-dependent enzyme [Tissierella sp. Yu-01]